MGKRVAIIGDGGWGTALAMTLERNGHDVHVWGPMPDYIERVRNTGRNEDYLAGVDLPQGIQWTADHASAVDGAELVVLASPSKFYADVANAFAAHIPKSAEVVSVAKGFDPKTSRRLSEVAGAILDRSLIAVLSGPSHAEEVARRVPTAVVLACADEARAIALQPLFMNDRFRVYTSNDVTGVELGGALKNVIAVAVGVSDGLGFGDNTRAALIARGVAEISRLGCALGASPDTFAGLSGLGDLVVTCSSRHSRNRRVGERLGSGESLHAITDGMKQVAEGIENCAIARELAHAAGVEVPITEQVYAMVHQARKPEDAVNELMLREARPE